MAVDATAIFAISIVSGVLYHLEFVKVQGNLSQFAGFAAVVAFLFVTLTKSRGLYALPELLNLKSQISRISQNWAIVFLFLTAAVFAMKVGDAFSRGATITFAFTGILVLLAVRLLWRIGLADGLAVRKFSGRRIALIAEKSISPAFDLHETLTQHGLQPAQQFVLPVEQSAAKKRKQIIAQAIKSIRGSDVEEIVISANLDNWTNLKELLTDLRVLPLPINLVPAGPLAEVFRMSSHTIGDTVTIEMQHGPRTWSQRFIKRVFDIVLGSIALLAFMPLFLITAIGIKIDSPGPILFRQRRRGFNGRPFQIFKFRTMYVQEDGDNIVAAQRNDARVTRIGNWLRRTSIDELPQLLNVLRGTMSIVGPRPHALAHDNEFENLLDKYAYRHHVKPGLTGWAQVNGYRGEMRTIADIEERVKYDLWYIDNWSLATDIRILFMTVTEVVDGKNAY
jgi:putative colanic acid biosynthesis UDP-glucose lipid carrier transferase